MAMCIGQLSGRASLRDLIMNLAAQSSKLYHLGIELCSRATLARVNEQQPASLYEAIFHKLLQQCRQFAPRHRFKFNGKLYLLDATVIDLCLSVFPWATFRKTKGAIKLHVGLDGDGYLPEFLDLTNGKSHEIKWAKTLKLQSCGKVPWPSLTWDSRTASGSRPSWRTGFSLSPGLRVTREYRGLAGG